MSDSTLNPMDKDNAQTLITIIENEKLHSEKMHQVMSKEVEKLRQWKLCKENLIEKLEDEIKFSKSAMNSLRKALLESQQDCEKISEKVHEDQVHFDEINKKLALNEEQMTLVKAQYETIGQYIENFRGLKSKFMALNDERVCEIEHIYKKFDHVTQEHENQINKLNEHFHFELVQFESQCDAQLHYAEDQLVKLQNALEESKTSERNLAQEKLVLKDQVEAMSTEKINNEREIDELKMKQQETEEKIESCEKRIKELELCETELMDAKKELSNEVKLSKEIITTLQNKVYHDGNAFLKERENMLIEIEKEKLRYNLLHKELKECEEDKQKLIEQVELTRKDLVIVNSELVSVKREKSELKDDLDNVEEKLKENQRKFQDLQATITQKENDFKLEISISNKSLETLNSNNQDLESKLRNAEEQEYNKSIEFVKLQTQLQDSAKNELIFKKEIQRLNEEREALEMRLQKLTTTGKQLEHENKQLKQEVDTTQYTIKELTSENTDLNEKVEKVTEENTSFKEQVSELEENLSNKMETIENLEQELETVNSSLKNKIKRDKTSAKTMESKIKNLKVDIETKRETIKSLEKDLKTVEEKCKSQSKEITKLERTLEEKNVELEEKLSELFKLASESKHGSEQNLAMKLEYQTLLKGLEADKTKLVAEKEEMIRFYDMKEKNYQRDISKKDAELEEYKKKVLDAERISTQDEMKESILSDLRKEKQDLETEYGRLIKEKDLKLTQVEEELQNLRKDSNLLKEQNANHIRQIELQQTEAKKAELLAKNYKLLETKLQDAKKLEMTLHDEIAKLMIKKPKTISEVLGAKLSSQVRQDSNDHPHTGKAPLAGGTINLSDDNSDSSSGIDAQVFIGQIEKSAANKRKLSLKLKESGKKALFNSSSGNSSSKNKSSSTVRVFPQKLSGADKGKPKRKLFRHDDLRLGEDASKSAKRD